LISLKSVSFFIDLYTKKYPELWERLSSRDSPTAEKPFAAVTPLPQSQKPNPNKLENILSEKSR
jgi:hypothetical protein